MAPSDVAAGDITKYLEKDIPAVIDKYDALWEIQDPEENPYKSKYEARKLLEAVLKEVERLLADAVPGSDDASLGSDACARFSLYLGKNHYFCEEIPTAEQLFNRSLERYLKSASRLVPDNFLSIQDVFNQLGMLWCNRHGHAEGMNYLRRAQIMFENRPDCVRQDPNYNQRSADNYTLTMFYLAQAYGALQKPGLSARFCAETMSQQLDHNTTGERKPDVKEKDPFDCKDWVRNCLSLSDFFVNEAMFWTAEYLLHSGSILCERCLDICGIKPEGWEELKAECARDLGNYYSTRLQFLRTCTQHPTAGEITWRGEKKRPSPENKEDTKGTVLKFTCAADHATGPAVVNDSPPIVWDSVFPYEVFLENEEAQDNRVAEETGSGADTNGIADEPSRAVGWLEYKDGERVRLPVHFKALHGYVERRIRKANVGFFAVRDEAPAAELKVEAFDQEGNTIPIPVQPSCAGLSFEAAREIFKLANHYQLKSLEYFQLDGWVTDHVRILQEISQMYRTIIFWERGQKRVAAMMTRRVRMLSPLLELLNPKVYIAFWRQLSFEMAEVNQQLHDLRSFGRLPENGGGHACEEENEEEKPMSVKGAARLNELANKSLKFYSTFIDSYHERGVVPDKVDNDNARVYLTARLNRARFRTKMRGLSREDLIEAHKLSLQEYEWLLDYGRRNQGSISHPDVNFEQELNLCQELAAMLPAKLSRIAQGKR